MKKFTLFCAFTAFFLAAINANALKLADMDATMQANIDKSRGILKANKNDPQKSADEVFALFDKDLDFELMARLSLSKNYKKLNAQQKKDFQAAFENHLKLSFIGLLGLYDDQDIRVVGHKAGEGKQRNTRMFLTAQMQAAGELREFVFKFHNGGGKDEWLIYDIDVAGISIVQTYRSQLGDLLENKDFDALMKALKDFKIEKK